ncbi:DUF2026 family protein [Candidatus Accumulibacter cognatus]|uniref:Uncharacterized protein n=1 Tax=Candidatus Accumulibacter cognatus TaxID=2954383 RepID=A0A080M993_9PROT|nr:DUF2026 family protein [Candidatus Accumulibacter cognatus]KFB77872.1 MAG: hypothetical protein AW06_000839 [Candidatus Accumulibacter cognatus]
MIRSPLLVPLADFERIFRTIHGVLVAKGFQSPEKCCQFFSIVGATILDKHYGLKAVPCFGVAAFNVGLQKHIAFASVNGCPSVNGFHAWVESEGWIVDFSSPLLSELAEKAGIGSCGRKMFQKPAVESAPSIEELDSELSFYVAPYQDFSAKRIDAFFESKLYVDVLYYCVNWYKRPPQKMNEPVLVGQNIKGEPECAFLSPFRVNGAW